MILQMLRALDLNSAYTAPMKIARLILLLMLATFVAPLHADDASVTTIILLRHAEKASNAADPRDPPLSAEGHQRAARIAEKLRDKNIAAVFATQYRRTQCTAAPTAKQNQLPVHLLWVGKRDIEQLAQELKQRIEKDYRGKTVLIVGHSNTVPVFAQVFSGQSIEEIREDEFDRWIEISLPITGKSSLQNSRY